MPRQMARVLAAFLAVSRNALAAFLTVSRNAFAAFLVALAFATPAAGWGPAGHDAVARVAAQRLTPASQKQVAALLSGQPMWEVAVWADEVRTSTHRHTNTWHFTNIPIASSGFSRTRDCRQGDCVVGAIERLAAALRDRSRPRIERQEALKFLIHFIGDIHQPLHAANAGDRGGGDRTIAPVGGSTNLHFAWDGGIIQSQNANAASLAATANRWLRTQTESTLSGGSPVEWANESFRIARDVVYIQVNGDNAILGAERFEAMRIIEKQIALAGLRLAALLNRVLAPSTT
jgi:hypothetical protein